MAFIEPNSNVGVNLLFEHFQTMQCFELLSLLDLRGEDAQLFLILVHKHWYRLPKSRTGGLYINNRSLFVCDYFYQVILFGCDVCSFCIFLCVCYTFPIHCIHALIDLMWYLTYPAGHSWADETLLKVSAVAPLKNKAVCNMSSWARGRSSKWFSARDWFLAINGTCKCRFHRL